MDGAATVDISSINKVSAGIHARIATSSIWILKLSLLRAEILYRRVLAHVFCREFRIKFRYS
jgi:hypothetical protein